MTGSEAVFIWLAVWVYGAAFLTVLYGLVFNRGRWIGRGWYLLYAGFAMQTASMAIRWVVTGHPPVMRVYENSALSVWFILVLAAALRRWDRRLEAVAAAILPIILLMLGNGLLSRPYLEPLSPPFKSNWLWFHVFFAWVAYGAFCVAAGLGITYLLKERAEAKRGLSYPPSIPPLLRGEEKGGFYNRLPGLDALNHLMLRTVIFGFIALTVEIGAGAIWAYNLWGRYWGWDPVETWSLITWLIYGADIHLGVTLGWKGKRMAWLVILSLISLFIAFGGIGYISGVHQPIL